MTFEKSNLPAFVPNGDSVRDTAILLVNLADKHGIPQTHIQVANDGFYISEELADLIGEDDDDETTVGEVASDLHVGDGPSAADPAGTIEADREQIELAEEIAETNEIVTVNEAPDTVTNGAVEDADVHGAVPDVDYSEWEYADLKVEAARRELVTEDQKAETLRAALQADDIAEVNDPETAAPTGE